MSCPYPEICPTTNFWVEEKKQYIKETCNTAQHICCTTFMDFKQEGIIRGSEEWKKRVRFFRERRKQFPPHGLIKVRMVVV